MFIFHSLKMDLQNVQGSIQAPHEEQQTNTEDGELQQNETQELSNPIANKRKQADNDQYGIGKKMKLTSKSKPEIENNTQNNPLILFWDIEIQQNVPDWSEKSVEAAEISVLCGVWSDGSENVRILLKKTATSQDVEVFVENVVRVFERADRLVAYNACAFDLIVLKKYVPEDLFNKWVEKTIDPMLMVRRNNMNFPVSLNKLACLNNVQGKCGNGINAPVLFQEEKYEDLIKYCTNDCEIIKNLWQKKQVIVYKKRCIDFTCHVKGTVGRFD